MASNFGGRKAPPFGKGKASAPSNVKRVMAKAVLRKRGRKNGK